MFEIKTFLVVAAVLTAINLSSSAAYGKPQKAVTRTLFVDDTYIESMSGLKRVVHQLKQYPGNPIIVQDKSWECHKEFRYYPSVVMWSHPVLRDPKTGKFRMWYGAYCDKDGEGKDTGMLLYAESDDGIHWKKPNLGIVEWNGSKENNIVLVGISDGKPGTLRYLDTPNIIYRPDEKDPKNRYRLLTAMYTGADVVEGVWLYRSPDGLRWELVKEDAIPNAREFNSFFWDERHQKYVGTVRIRRPVIPRHVGYTESKDFVNWTPAEVIVAPENLNTKYNLSGDDVYGLISFPYESHYLGFMHSHHTDRRLEVQLMSSADARSWKFVGEGEYALPNDPPGGYGQGMMSTMSGCPIRVGDELWVYIGIAPKAHTNPTFTLKEGQQQRAIGLAKIRLDGFASLEAGNEKGSVTTKPFKANRKSLLINADASKGTITAEVLGEDGKPLPGLLSADCVPVKSDGVKLAVRWKRAKIPAGQTVKLRFNLKDAAIYSYWVE